MRIVGALGAMSKSGPPRATASGTRRACLLRRPEDRQPAVARSRSPARPPSGTSLRGRSGSPSAAAAPSASAACRAPCRRRAGCRSARRGARPVRAAALARTISTYSRVLAERLPPRLPVPALDDLRPRRPEPEEEAAAGEEVERRRRHRRVRRRAAGDLHDRRAELDASSSSRRATRGRSRSPCPRPRRPTPSRTRDARPPARARSARAGSSPAARTPCRSRDA